MKIVMVNTADAGGGAEGIASKLADGLRQRGHTVSFLCARAHRADSRSTLGIADWVLGRTLRRIGFADAVSLAALRFLQYPEVREADLIHFHNLHGFYFGMAALPRIVAAKPCVWTLHDSWALSGGCYSHLNREYLPCNRWLQQCSPCPGHGVFPMTGILDTASQMLKLKRRALRAFVKHAGSVTGVSQWMTNRAAESFAAAGLDASRVSWVPNFVDMATDGATSAPLPVALPSDRPVILMAAANINFPVKGIGTALAALGSLLYRPFTLLIVGTPLPESLLQEYGLADRAIQLGLVYDRGTMAAAYRAATVTLVPSLAESFSLVAAESIACGTPVVASEVMALPELVRPGQTGFLAEANDTADFAQKLEGVLALPPDQYASLRASTREFARHRFLSYSAWLDRYLEVYHRAIKDRTRAA